MLALASADGAETANGAVERMVLLGLTSCIISKAEDSSPAPYFATEIGTAVQLRGGSRPLAAPSGVARL